MTKDFVEVECKNSGLNFGTSYRYQWATVIPKDKNLANM
jgi:hypothetical protein